MRIALGELAHHAFTHQGEHCGLRDFRLPAGGSLHDGIGNLLHRHHPATRGRRARQDVRPGRVRRRNQRAEKRQRLDLGGIANCEVLCNDGPERVRGDMHRLDAKRREQGFELQCVALDRERLLQER
ncbi:hypothetical protein D3C87_1761830 [compost metagenome]